MNGNVVSRVVGSAGQTTPQTPVMNELDALQSQMTDLFEELDYLESKLAPVLEPVGDDGEIKGSALGRVVPKAESLRVVEILELLSRYVGSAKDRVAALRRRLEI